MTSRPPTHSQTPKRSMTSILIVVLKPASPTPSPQESPIIHFRKPLTITFQRPPPPSPPEPAPSPAGLLSPPHHRHPPTHDQHTTLSPSASSPPQYYLPSTDSAQPLLPRSNKHQRRLASMRRPLVSGCACELVGCPACGCRRRREWCSGKDWTGRVGTRCKEVEGSWVCE